MKHSKKPCKPGKTPTGKNGRCVKSKTEKRCKPGKTPTGKNGRCVKSKTLKQKKTFSKLHITNEKSPSQEEKLVRRQINQFMDDLGDDEFFSKTEIEHFVKIAIQKKLTPSQIEIGLEQQPKGYGVFE
jgi:hypothetical protein